MSYGISSMTVKFTPEAKDLPELIGKLNAMREEKLIFSYEQTDTGEIILETALTKDDLIRHISGTLGVVYDWDKFTVI